MLYCVFAGISLALITFSAFLPFENLFITFSSPEAAYEYYMSRKPNIELIVEGDNCDLVVDRNNDSGNSYLIIPKTSDGWKVGIGSDTKRIVQKFSNGIDIVIYQYKNTNDYFITIFNMTGEEIQISDNYNTEFYSLKTSNDLIGKTYFTYYAHIHYSDSQYSVIVDGNTIIL
jgi:hypothetical protein